MVSATNLKIVPLKLLAVFCLSVILQAQSQNTPADPSAAQARDPSTTHQHRHNGEADRTDRSTAATPKCSVEHYSVGTISCFTCSALE